MEIAPATKISALIKANPAAIDAIASINKHFEKLRNPILRKVLAARVTIADAARIGGCGVETFFEKLAPLGFTVKWQTDAPEPKAGPAVPVFPLFLEKLPQNAIIPLDVREDISTGNDPFLVIMKAVDQINGKNALVIINTFEPTPLIQILQKRGYASFTVEKNPEEVHCYFWLEKSPETTSTNASVGQVSFEATEKMYEGKLQHLDVRQMEMPQPMIAILHALEKLPAGQALHVTHRRVPRYLLPQLQERGFAIAIKEVGPEQVNLLIFKEK